MRLCIGPLVALLFTHSCDSSNVKGEKGNNSSNNKDYTLILTYKLHESLNDNAKTLENKEIIQASSDENAYKRGTTVFSNFAGSWNDTAFCAPLEPISFKITNQNNIDVRNIIPQSKIQQLDSLMWVEIKRQRMSMSKAKSDFEREADSSFNNFFDSVKKNLKEQ